MLDRYMDSPVLMSFNSNPKPITEIPFPAITICNMNKARTVRTSIQIYQKKSKDRLRDPAL